MSQNIKDVTGDQRYHWRLKMSQEIKDVTEY